MRTSLVPSFLRNASTNRRQRVDDVRLYEIASVYHPRPDLGRTRRRPGVARLAGVLVGRRTRRAGPRTRSRWTSTTPRPPSRRCWRRSASTRAGSARAARGSTRGSPQRCSRARRRGPRRGRRAPPARRGGVRAAAGRARVPAIGTRSSGGAARPRSTGHPALPRRPARSRGGRRRGDRGGRVCSRRSRQEPLVEDATLFDVYRGPPLPRARRTSPSPSATAPPIGP